MALSDEIKSLIKGDVDDSSSALEKYSRDASLFCVRPAVVVFPKDVEDIKKLVRFVGEERSKGRAVSLTARSAGTDMTGGPLTESIVMDMTKYFNRLIEIGADYAVVEPGMYYRDFEKQTLAKGLLMPSYPASRELCTIGGMVANNAGGEKTLQYGKTERYVESLRVVLADGNEYVFSLQTPHELIQKEVGGTFESEIYKRMYALIAENLKLLLDAKPAVTKNSSGYYLWNVLNPKTRTFDLTKLLVGSQGTLGIITQIKLKLIRPKPVSRLMVIFIKNLDSLTELTERILPFKPESLESYDDSTFKLAFKFFPEILHQIKGNFLRLVLSSIPEAWFIVTGGIPKLVLLAEFSGDTVGEVEKIMHTAADELRRIAGVKVRVTKSEEESQEFWIIRHESFNLLRKHVRGLRTAPFIDDFSVQAHLLPKFLPELYKILGEYKMIYTVAGHVGDGNFHIIPLMDPTDPKMKDTIVSLSKKVYDLVIRYKGSITSEHNDGLIRTPFLPQAYGNAVYKLFEQTKKIFDPLGIFNPGKKVGGTLDYALAHLDTRKA